MNTVVDPPRCPPTVIDWLPPRERGDRARPGERSPRCGDELLRFCPDCGAPLRVSSLRVSVPCGGCGVVHDAARFALSWSSPARVAPPGRCPFQAALAAVVAFARQLLDPRADRFVKGLLFGARGGPA